MPLKNLMQTLRRAGTLGRLVMGARLARREIGAEREAAQRALAERLASARGIPLKIGQFLGSTGQVPAFQDLAVGIAPFPWERIRREIERSLGGPLEEHFASIETTGLAASLGQVHRATLHTGEAVAVKVRYPDIAQAVESELRLANLIPGVGPVRTWGFNLEGYKRLLRDDLREELDYRAERARQERFAAQMNVSGLVVPRVFPSLCSDSLLVQSWEEGVLLEEAARWPEPQRRQIAAILLCTLLQSLFVHGETHADPHTGNYRYRRVPGSGPEVVLMDYGCTVRIDPTARLAFLRLLLDAIENNDTDPLTCFQAMGFEMDKLTEIRAVLPALSRVLFAPFLDPRPFWIDRWDLRQQVDGLLGETKWWFRSAGPPKLLLLMRAFQGLAIQLKTLDVDVSWQELLFRVLDPALCEEARSLVLPPLPEPLASRAHSFSALARYLQVRVTEGEREVIRVTYPAGQTAVLHTIVPDEIRTKIHAAGIDLPGIQQRACAGGLGPQVLFAFEDGTRTYRVWLE